MSQVPLDFREVSVESLATGVRRGAFSAAELTDAALARIEQRDPGLHAFVAVDADSARAQAAAIDDRVAAGEDVGPLAGIPIGVKDLEDAAGFRTTRGAAHLAQGPVLDRDATEVARLRAAGCVVIGKTNTPEAGFVGDTYNPTFGPTVNPWNRERSPGGSSGGTSAAVAGGLVPLGTGSDGGGSIRIPSALCGMSGFKPSQGRIPAGPTPLGAADLSTVGPMARRIRDVALALDVVVGPDPNDLRSLPRPGASFRSACDDPAPPQRLLFCPSLDGSDIDDEILRHTMGAVDRIRATGVEVVETDPVMPEVFAPFLLLFFGNMVIAYRDLLGTDAMADVTPQLADILAMSEERVTADSLEEARRQAQAISIELAESMRGFDALISPTVVGHAPLSQRGGTVNGEEVLGWVGNTYGLNVTRRPAGTTPIGLADDGMPLGLQIVGHQLDDVRTVELTAWAEDLFALDLVAPFPS